MKYLSSGYALTPRSTGSITDTLYNLCSIYRRLYQEAEPSMKTIIVSTLVKTDIVRSFWKLIESSPDYISLLQFANPGSVFFMNLIF